MSNSTADDLLPEYDLDYEKSVPNRFAGSKTNLVLLDEKVAGYLRAKASGKGIALDALVNDLLQRDIDLIETIN